MARVGENLALRLCGLAMLIAPNWTVKKLADRTAEALARRGVVLP